MSAITVPDGSRMPITSDGVHRVVIVGGGFGGLEAALGCGVHAWR